MYKPLHFAITGMAPLLMHNGQLADPLNDIAKKMKAIAGKRKKTDADFEELAKLEFLGGLYLDDKERPVVPGELIESMLAESAKSQRMGKQFKAGVICDGAWSLLYDGPKNADSLWENKGFRDTRGVRIGQNKVMRTRPVFMKWSLKFTVQFLDDVMNEAQVREILTHAGRLVGIGDYRPKFGRFEVA